MFAFCDLQDGKGIMQLGDVDIRGLEFCSLKGLLGSQRDGFQIGGVVAFL